MAATITFAGITLMDSAWGGGYDFLPGVPNPRRMEFVGLPRGRGEFVKIHGTDGVDHKLKLIWHVPDADLDDRRAIIQRLVTIINPIVGTLAVVGYPSFPFCVAKTPEPVSDTFIHLDMIAPDRATNPGRRLEYDLTFRQLR